MSFEPSFHCDLVCLLTNFHFDFSSSFQCYNPEKGGKLSFLFFFNFLYFFQFSKSKDENWKILMY